MTEHAKQLHATADRQIAELIGLITTLDEPTSRLPCPGREKLGDGTIGASARHTADNYQRLAAFVQTSDRMSETHAPNQHAGHRSPRFLRAFGHGPQTTANTARAPANTTTSTRPTTSIRVPSSRSSPPRAPRSAGLPR